MMNYIMIDIETMSHKPNAAIVSIGAAQFDINTGEIGKKFYVNVDLVSSHKMGLDISPETVLWWLKQSKEAKNSLGDCPVSLTMAMDSLHGFIAQFDTKINIWANSPSFDLVILQSAFDACSIKCPWFYWQERCLRTLVAFNPTIKKSIINDFAHDALSDCLYQIKYCVAVWNSLKK